MFSENDDPAKKETLEILNKTIPSVHPKGFVCGEHLSVSDSLTDVSCSEDRSWETHAALLRNALVLQAQKFSKKIPPTYFEEYKRLLIDTEKAFLKIRSSDHLLRIIRTFGWFREKQALHRFSSGKRSVFFRIFQSKLRFDFGQRSVLSLIISVSTLQPFERFDFPHILRAARNVFPDLDLVPHSCFSFRHPEDKTISYYVELERQDGRCIPFSDREILKKLLLAQLETAIERVEHHLDIPQNDEDTIRNSLLLSQQLKEIGDSPQMVVHFQSQTNDELEFLVTYMRVVEPDKKNLPPEMLKHTTLVNFELVSSFISGSIALHLKQVFVFRVRCAKEPFFRLDHSIDFLKSREFVTHCVDEALGKARDLNGGLICLQYNLLNKVKSLLSENQIHDTFLLEEFFYSLRPEPMKSLLEPGHVSAAFAFYLSLRSTVHKGAQLIRQETRKELFLGFVYPENLSIEEILRTASSFGIKEHELAVSLIKSDDTKVCIILLLTHDDRIRVSFSAWVQKTLEYAKNALPSRETLRLSLSCPVHLLDPRVGTDFISGIVIKMLYEGLMRLDASGTPTLAAAERVDISQDGLRYTFTLRESAWTNGRAITAYDFEYAWKKVLDPNFKTFFDYLFYPIKNAQLVKLGQLPSDALGVHVIDDKTLVVELDHPASYFLELCCLWIYSPLSCEMDTLRPGWAFYEGANYICNGPFQLLTCNPKSHIQLVRNDRYWDKEHVFIDEIQISIIEDIDTSLNLFVKGELDWIGEPLHEMHLDRFKQTGLKIHSQPIASVLWFILNSNNPLLGSKKIRQAFSCALDRYTLIKKCLHGDERPSHSILPACLSLLDPDTPLPFDLCYARTLFEEGLKDLGIDRQRLLLPVLVQDREPHRTIAREAARMWEQAFGISFTMTLVKRKEFLSTMAELRHAIILMGWASWYNDPQYSLDVLKETSLRINPTTWTNAEVVDLLKQADTQQGKEARNSCLKRAETLVMNEMPIVPVYDYIIRYMKNECLDGVVVSRLGTIDFRWAKIKRMNVCL